MKKEYSDAANALMYNSWELRLPFGLQAMGTQYGIYDHGKCICPFCFKDVMYDEKGFPTCCETYNNYKSQIEELVKKQKELDAKMVEINESIRQETNKGITKYSLEVAKNYKECFEEIIKKLENT